MSTHQIQQAIAELQDRGPGSYSRHYAAEDVILARLAELEAENTRLRAAQNTLIEKVGAVRRRACELRANTTVGGGEFELGMHVAASAVLGLPSVRG